MSELDTFHADVKNILEQARGKARSAVNAAMVEAYWLIAGGSWKRSNAGSTRRNMAHA